MSPWTASTPPSAAVTANRPRPGWSDLDPFAEGTGWPWAHGRRRLGRALLAAPGDAPAPGRRALRAHHAHPGGRPSLRPARTHLAYGEFLRRNQRRVDARTHLRAALETFEDLRAEPLAARATQELRASGETARKRDPSTQLNAHPDGAARSPSWSAKGCRTRTSPPSAGCRPAPSPSTCATSSPRPESPPAASSPSSTSASHVRPAVAAAPETSPRAGLRWLRALRASGSRLHTPWTSVNPPCFLRGMFGLPGRGLVHWLLRRLVRRSAPAGS